MSRLPLLLLLLKWEKIYLLQPCEVDVRWPQTCCEPAAGGVVDCAACVVTRSYEGRGWPGDDCAPGVGYADDGPRLAAARSHSDAGNATFAPVTFAPATCAPATFGPVTFAPVTFAWGSGDQVTCGWEMNVDGRCVSGLWTTTVFAT